MAARASTETPVERSTGRSAVARAEWLPALSGLLLVLGIALASTRPLGAQPGILREMRHPAPCTVDGVGLGMAPAVVLRGKGRPAKKEGTGAGLETWRYSATDCVFLGRRAEGKGLVVIGVSGGRTLWQGGREVARVGQRGKDVVARLGAASPVQSGMPDDRTYSFEVPCTPFATQHARYASGALEIHESISTGRVTRFELRGFGERR